MKTKTIDVWVDKEKLENSDLYNNKSVSTRNIYPIGNAIKCKLIIPVEEKKVEITRSELMDKIGKIEFVGFRQYSREVADKVFGEEEE